MNALTIQTNQERDYPGYRTARLILLSALLTGLCIGGALSFPFWYGLGLYYAPAPIRAQWVAYLSPDSLRDFWQPGVVLGAVVWGVALGRLSGVRPLWRLGIAAGFGVFIGEVLVTAAPFLRLQHALWPEAPPHLRFVIEFVVGVGLAAGITGLLLGLAIRWGQTALGLALGMSLAAALPALAVAMGLDALGVRWGAGNASMAKVAGLGFPAATLSAGVVMGWYLAKFGPQH